MARQGLNCTLSYQRGGVNHTYRVRVNSITHGIQMLGSESQARMMKAFYPRRVTTQRFYLGVVLKGYEEHKNLTNWLMDYVSYAVDPNHAGVFRSMDVMVPSRDFVHRGVPLAGYQWGDKVGKIMWSTTLEFEAAYEPWSSKATPDTSAVENLDAVYKKEKAAKHWYPEGIQLSGDEQPVDFDRIVSGFSDRWNDSSTGGGGTTGGVTPSSSGSGSGFSQNRENIASGFQDNPQDFAGGL